MEKIIVKYAGYPGISNRIAWLDRLKIAAAFAVVMTHIASISWQAVDVMSDSWFVSSVYEIATRFCVPAFFFCTGAVLLNPKKPLPPVKVRAYALRALLCALCVSSLYVLLEISFDGWFGWKNFALRVIDGPYFIWYLWVLLGLYLLMPVLRLVALNQYVLSYVCLLLFVFVIGKSTVITMLPGSVVDIAYGNFILFNRGEEALFYCLLGAWFVSHRLSKRLENAILAVGAFSLLMSIGLNAISARAIGPDLYYVGRDNALICMFSLSIFVGFSRWGNYRSLSNIEQVVCNCGLFVYLLHPFFRLIFERVSIFGGLLSSLMNQPLFMIPIVTSGCYVASLILSITLNNVYKRLSICKPLS